MCCDCDLIHSLKNYENNANIHTICIKYGSFNAFTRYYL